MAHDHTTNTALGIVKDYWKIALSVILGVIALVVILKYLVPVLIIVALLGTVVLLNIDRLSKKVKV